MPNLEEHCRRTLQRYKVEGRDIHSWIDNPSRKYAGSHRQFRHDTETIKLVGQLFGKNYGEELARNIALDHIMADHETEIKSSNLNNAINSENLKEVPLLNGYFEKLFFPSREQASSKNQTPNADSIICNYLVLYGSQDDRRSTANSIAGLALNKYGKENVNACFSKDGNLNFLMHRGLESKLVNVIFADNLTFANNSNEIWRNWCTLRTKFRDKFEGLQPNGIILAIMGIDRYSRVKPSFLRSIVNGTIVRGDSLDSEDSKTIYSYFGKIDLTDFLKENIEDEKQDKKPDTNNIFVSRTEKGFIELPLRDEFYFHEPLTLSEVLRKLHERKE